MCLCCCSVLQGASVDGSRASVNGDGIINRGTLQNIAPHSATLYHSAPRFKTMHHTAPHCHAATHTRCCRRWKCQQRKSTGTCVNGSCRVLQCASVVSVLQCASIDRSKNACSNGNESLNRGALQLTATHYNKLHHTTPHCTTLHRTAPHCTTLQLTQAAIADGRVHRERAQDHVGCQIISHPTAWRHMCILTPYTPAGISRMTLEHQPLAHSLLAFVLGRVGEETPKHKH